MSIICNNIKAFNERVDWFLQPQEPPLKQRRLGLSQQAVRCHRLLIDFLHQNASWVNVVRQYPAIREKVGELGTRFSTHYSLSERLFRSATPDLPPEIWQTIFQELPVFDLCQSMSVCKDWMTSHQQTLLSRFNDREMTLGQAGIRHAPKAVQFMQLYGPGIRCLKARDVVMGLNPLLKIMQAAGPLLKTLEISVSGISCIDSNCLPKMNSCEKLHIESWDLEVLHLPRFDFLKNLQIDCFKLIETRFPDFPLLETLRLSSEAMQGALSLPGMPLLKYLRVHVLGLTSLVLQPLPALEFLQVTGMCLIQLEHFIMPSLKTIKISSEQFQMFSTEKFPVIEEVALTGASLRAIDLAQPSVKKITVKAINLRQLDLPAHSALEHLFIEDHGMTLFEIPASLHLSKAEIVSYRLQRLVVGSCPSLVDLTIKGLSTLSLELDQSAPLEEYALNGQRYVLL